MNLTHPPSKRRLRRQIRRLRDAIPPEELKSRSQVATQHLIKLIVTHDFLNVMVYFHIRSEVRTHELVEFLLQENRTVLAPVVVGKGKLEAYQVLDPKRDLHVAEFGISTPILSRCEHLPPERLDCIIVPGIAFQEEGWRIGYGGGYYDRFLPRCPQAHTIGAAFEMQMVPNAFPEVWDQPLKQIATEERIIDCIHPPEWDFTT